MMTPAEVVRGYLAAFGKGDPAAIAAFVAEDFENEHLSELGSGCTGRTEYLNRLPGFLGTFTNQTYTVLDLVGSDQPRSTATVVVRYRFDAVFEGTAIAIPGVMWFNISGGLIVRRTDLWDSLTFLNQTSQPDDPSPKT